MSFAEKMGAYYSHLCEHMDREYYCGSGALEVTNGGFLMLTGSVT